MNITGTSRRSFLKTSILGTAGMSVLLNPLKAGNLFSFGQNKIEHVGIIANTVANEMKTDYVAALERIAEIGYSYIEGGYRGKSAKKYGKLLDKIGLKSIASGASMHPMLTSMEKLFNSAEALNQEYIVCYWPWLDDADNITREQCFTAANNLNSIGKACKDAGFKFAWHNHDKEFVDVELDLYWVVKAKHDPVDCFKKYPGRYKLFHVKDMDKTEEGGICCVGDGIIDFAKIFSESLLSGVEYFIVENETRESNMKCAEDSFNSIKSLRF